MERDLRQLYDDFCTGAGLLSRLPLPGHRPRGVASAWAWPVVGLVLGGLAVLAGHVALALGLAAPLAAVVVLTVQVVLTGGLHEDGLADTADGLWGGWTRERRLEIMKDSRTGSYGVVALILGFAARITAVTLLLEAGALGALVVAAVLSRGVLPGVMALVPNARVDGLSRGMGRPTRGAAALSAGIAVVLALLLAGWAAIGAVLVVLLMACALSLLARARIGGQTGDILGAVQFVAEVAVLMVLS